MNIDRKCRILHFEKIDVGRIQKIKIKIILFLNFKIIIIPKLTQITMICPNQ